MKNYAKLKKAVTTAPHHFARLGVHLEATVDELKAAHRKLARMFHPDVNADPAAGGIMADLNVAYETLLDDKRRRTYVQLLGKPCAACKGRGHTQKQKGFTKVVSTICNICQGAGHVAVKP